MKNRSFGQQVLAELMTPLFFNVAIAVVLISTAMNIVLGIVFEDHYLSVEAENAPRLIRDSRFDR